MATITGIKNAVNELKAKMVYDIPLIQQDMGIINNQVETINSDLTDIQSDITDLQDDKADKVTGATSGNLAGLDADGNLTDSGSKPADFEPADDTILKEADVIDNLTSTDTDKPLSANQGKVLDEKVITGFDNTNATLKAERDNGSLGDINLFTVGTGLELTNGILSTTSEAVFTAFLFRDADTENWNVVSPADQTSLYLYGIDSDYVIKAKQTGTFQDDKYTYWVDPDNSAVIAYVLDSEDYALEADYEFTSTSVWMRAKNDAYTRAEVDDLLDDKADKVSDAVSGNFAGLDAQGNLTDSGYKADDFELVDETILRQADVIDDLVSEDTDYPLSANQGKVLKDELDALDDIAVKKQSTITLENPSQSDLDALNKYLVGDIVITYTSNPGTMYFNGFISRHHSIQIDLGNTGSSSWYLNSIRAPVTIRNGGQSLISIDQCHDVTLDNCNGAINVLNSFRVKTNGSHSAYQCNLNNSTLILTNTFYANYLNTEYGGIIILEGSASLTVLQGLSKLFTVIDNRDTSTQDTYMRSGTGLTPADIIDDLTHTDADKALSANQGYILNQTLENVVKEQPAITLTNPTQNAINALEKYLTGDLTINFTVNTTGYSPALLGFLSSGASSITIDGTGSSGSMPLFLYNVKCRVNITNLELVQLYTNGCSEVHIGTGTSVQHIQSVSSLVIKNSTSTQEMQLSFDEWSTFVVNNPVNLSAGISGSGTIVLNSGDATWDTIPDTVTVIDNRADTYNHEKDTFMRTGSGLTTADIINNLTSTDTNKALSAYQGKVLKDTLDGAIRKQTASEEFTNPTQAQIDSIDKYLMGQLWMQWMSFGSRTVNITGFLSGGVDDSDGMIYVLHDNSYEATEYFSNNDALIYIDKVGTSTLYFRDNRFVRIHDTGYTMYQGSVYLYRGTYQFEGSTYLNNFYAENCEIIMRGYFEAQNCSIGPNVVIHMSPDTTFNCNSSTDYKPIIMYDQIPTPGDNNGLETYVRADNSDNGRQNLYGHTANSQFTIPIVDPNEDGDWAMKMGRYDENGNLRTQNPAGNSDTEVVNTGWLSGFLSDNYLSKSSEIAGVLYADSEADAITLAASNPNALVFYPESAV